MSFPANLVEQGRRGQQQGKWGMGTKPPPNPNPWQTTSHNRRCSAITSSLLSKPLALRRPCGLGGVAAQPNDRPSLQRRGLPPHTHISHKLIFIDRDPAQRWHFPGLPLSAQEMARAPRSYLGISGGVRLHRFQKGEWHCSFSVSSANSKLDRKG